MVGDGYANRHTQGNQEPRVPSRPTPQSVAELTALGHEVWVETHAGAAIGFADEDYLEVRADRQEFVRGVPAGAVDRQGQGAPGGGARQVASPPHAVYLPAPGAGSGADRRADGQRRHLYRLRDGDRCAGPPAFVGADVTVLDKSVDALRRLDALYGNRITTFYSSRAAVREQVLAADLVIGGVLIPGAAAPKLITADMVRQMKAGAVLVDVAIDQGGCAETSRATTHAEPTYVVDDVVHYCVANMPGAVARTSTLALNNATLPFVVALAQKGTHRALQDDAHLLNGLNVARGVITCGSVAEAHGLPFQSAAGVLEHLS